MGSDAGVTDAVTTTCATSPEPRGARRALLAEDDETNQLYAISLLERDGWQVDLAGTGREAVALASASAYDVILMDCQVPELDGYEATQEIRRREGATRHTVIVALTAHATRSDRERCSAAGMDAYLAKPFDLASLEDELKLVHGRELADRPGAERTSGSASQRDQAPVFDASRLAVVSGSVREQLPGLFLDGAGRCIADLAAAEAAGDKPTAQRLAHTLKGSAATVGAMRLSVACAELGEALATGPVDTIAARQADLEAAFALTKQLIRPQQRDER
jgi:CheY-like chemotaxis protein